MTQNIQQALESISLEKQALEQKQSALQEELSALTGQLKTLALSYRQLSKVCGKEDSTTTGVYTTITITNAVQDVLSTSGHPMTTAEIAKTLTEGGYLSTAHRFNSMLHSILKRRDDIFKRTADGKCWMLCSQGVEVETEEVSITEADEAEDDDAVEALTKVFSKNKTLTISSQEKDGE